MNPNINMHGMSQPQMGVAGASGPNPMMQPGVSPVMMQAQVSPQQAGAGMGPQGPMQQQAGNPAQQQQQQQQQAEKIDNISKVKSFLGPMRESLFLTVRSAAFALQQNYLIDNLKPGHSGHSARFDKHLEEFTSSCDQMESHLKTAAQCMQQLSSSQHYLPSAVTAARMEPYMQDNPTGPMPYPTYLNTARVHVQSAKDIHDTLISAAQNISQAD